MRSLMGSWVVIGCLLWLPVATVRADAANCSLALLERFAGETLKYGVQWKGFSLNSERRIERTETGWQAINRSSLLFMSIEEETRFRLEGLNLISEAYRYERHGLSDKRNLRLEFNGPGRVRYFSPRGDGVLDVEPPVFDLLNHQLQMRIDLSCRPSRDEYRYTIARHDHVSEYRYRVLGTESVTTEAGTFEAVKLERGEAGDHIDHIWLAPALDHLIVRMVRTEDGETAELELKKRPDR